MDLSGIPLFRAMAKRMAWLGERQQVLAQNVANADTPGYVAQDLKKPSFREMVAGGAKTGLLTSSPKHFATGAGVHHAGFQTVRPGGAERTPSGNAVDIEQEMMKVGETATEHHLAASLYKRHIAMIRAALGRGAV